MTVTLSPIGDLLAVEHWSTRGTCALTAEMKPDDVRRAMLEPMAPMCEDIAHRLHRRVTRELYVKGAPSMIEVGPTDAELVFGVAVPGRPDTSEKVLVDVPPVKHEGRMGKTKVVQKRARIVPPVTRRHVSHPILDDVERAMVIALTHFRLIAAGHPELSLRGASADYREDIIVTADGRSGSTLWWLGQASVAGAKVPTPTRLDGQFTLKGELVLRPRKKQVS